MLTRRCGTGETRRTCGDGFELTALVGGTCRLSRDGQDARHFSHNPEVAGSNPAPATRSVAPSDHGRGLLHAVCKRICKRDATHAAVPVPLDFRIKSGAAARHSWHAPYAGIPRTCDLPPGLDGTLRHLSRPGAQPVTGMGAGITKGKRWTAGCRCRWPGWRGVCRWWGAARPAALALGRTARGPPQHRSPAPAACQSPSSRTPADRACRSGRTVLPARAILSPRKATVKGTTACGLRVPPLRSAHTLDSDLPQQEPAPAGRTREGTGSREADTAQRG